MIRQLCLTHTHRFHKCSPLRKKQVIRDFFYRLIFKKRVLVIWSNTLRKAFVSLTTRIESKPYAVKETDGSILPLGIFSVFPINSVRYVMPRSLTFGIGAALSAGACTRPAFSG